MTNRNNKENLEKAYSISVVTTIDNLPYPSSVSKENVKIYEVSDSDIPQNYGGINREKYSYGELRRQPIIPEILTSMVKNETLREYANACNERNKHKGFQMHLINGEYSFWGLRVGPVIHAPSVEELRQILNKEPKTAIALKNKEVTEDMIRSISYSLLRRVIGEECGMSEKEAGSAIGKQLDCVPHEDEAGYIYMVPNWAHNWFRHKGYVSKVLPRLNS